jgi:hypothetical protein
MWQGSENMDFSKPADQQTPAAGYVPGRSIVLVRNPSWDQSTDDLRSAYPDQIQTTIGGDNNDLYNKLQAGAIDYVVDGIVPPQLLKQYETNPDIQDQLHINSSDGVRYLSMDLGVPPFDDIHIRKAMNWVLDKAGMPYPRKITDPRDINSLSIVKLHHAKKKLERGFFTCASYQEYKEKSEQLIRQGVIDRECLEGARMEEYIIGPVFNLDFFYSPLERQGERVELIGVDWRFESSLDGHVRIPAAQQLTLNEDQKVPEYTVCGHNSATLRESLLENAFKLAEQYVEAAKEHFSPGIIGPFCLQTCVDKDLKFYIYDVAPRIGGGTNVHMNVGHAYGNSLWRKNMSTGRRLAMEVRRAVEEGRVKEIVT